MSRWLHICRRNNRITIIPWALRKKNCFKRQPFGLQLDRLKPPHSFTTSSPLSSHIFQWLIRRTCSLRMIWCHWLSETTGLLVIFCMLMKESFVCHWIIRKRQMFIWERVCLRIWPNDCHKSKLTGKWTTHWNSFQNLKAFAESLKAKSRVKKPASTPCPKFNSLCLGSMAFSFSIC